MPLFTDAQLAAAESARQELLAWLWKDPGALRNYDRQQLEHLQMRCVQLSRELDALLRVQVHEDDGEVEP